MSQAKQRCIKYAYGFTLLQAVKELKSISEQLSYFFNWICKYIKFAVVVAVNWTGATEETWGSHDVQFQFHNCTIPWLHYVTLVSVSAGRGSDLAKYYLSVFS